MVSYSVYDGDNRVRRYGEALVKAGYEVDAFALWRVGHESLGDVVNGVRVHRIQGRIKNEKSKFDYLWRLLAFFVRSLWHVTRQNWKRPYDLVHVHSVPDFEVFAAAFAKLSGAKVILDVHDIVPEFYASKFHTTPESFIFKALVALERASTSYADHVIASNHIWAERLISRSVRRSKVTAIINYPDMRVFQRQGRTPSGGKFVMLYPGNLAYHQGVDLAVRAMAQIRHEAPQAEFHIYGSGDQLEFLKKLVAELGLQEKVLFKGSLVVEELVRVMENADLGIVPKRKNGFGNEAFSTKIPEFMAMGVPVVIPNTDIDKYYFDDAVAKFFVAGDEASLADAMLTMIRDADLRQKLAQNASAFVQNFSWEKNQALYLDVVRVLLETRGTQRAQVAAPSRDGSR